MRKITANKMSNKAGTLSKAMTQEAEEILLHTERAIKTLSSIKDHARLLKMAEESLAEEGINAIFDKRVSRTAMKKHASEDEVISEEEAKALVEKVTEAVVEEFEEALKDADKICEEEIKKQFEDSEGKDSIEEIEASIKSNFEKNMRAIGINAKLSRNHRTKTASRKRK